MSQEKVNRYKEEKANRQKIMKKEKRVRRIEITVAVVALAALVGWFSVAVYKNAKANAEENAEAVVTDLDVSAFDNYINNIDTEETSESEEETDESSENAEESADTSEATEEAE